MTSPRPTAVYERDGALFQPSGLARGPWDERAQHGGAPAALLAHLAEEATGPAFALARLTFELTRPVPIAPLTVRIDSGRARTARRLRLEIEHEGLVIGRAVALMIRRTAVEVPATPDRRLTPAPAQCRAGFETPGMPAGESFHHEAMEIRVARGSTRAAGPAAAWFRLRMPLLAGIENTATVRAVAAADFGNGISWVLPADDFLFANTDLTVYLHRAPEGEWIGLDSETITGADGIGLNSSTLYDSHGRIGVAHQNLLIRPR
ncbi:hypothetical protein SAOR_04930 [Salinisphaera orenii MK-B5]|uniref:Acyl-CoA thioesterase n=1 Tax=Salinisphaera orenii MK-B5 TaxID=856730 RepID=A0A423PTF5_9GAMM|nr:acyl-CoA thioesterase domain-containing protein [Salinisphaera orenii]ROO28848.1 hypothetical protein SAOR_04930 [Salinisphaera orenii MK-B5]